MKLENLNLLKKIHKIQSEIDKFARDTQGFNYKYTSGSTVLNKIRPLMNENGLILKQEIISIKSTPIEYINSFGKKKLEILNEVDFKFTWIDIETGEFDENLWSANGMNDFEKGVGSASTYAERYFLLKYFHIPSDEDDVDNKDRKPQNNSKQQKNSNKKDYKDMTEKEKIETCVKFVNSNRSEYKNIIDPMLKEKELKDMELKELEAIVETIKITKKKGA